MSEIGEAIAKAGLSALLLLAAGVLPPLAAGTVLQLITGRFRRRVAEVFGARFCIWSTAPGVMLHEFSHALLCVVFRHRITDFALFSPQKNGNLGWVAHKWNPRSLWQNIGCFFIGVAPIAFGVAALVFLTLLLLPAESLPFPPLPGSGLEAFRFQFRTTFLALCRFWIEPDLLLRWRSWLWLYAVFAIGSQITLSRADLAGAGSGIAVLGTVLVLLAVSVAALLPPGITLPPAAIRCSAALCGLLFYLLLLFGLLTLILELCLAGHSSGKRRR